MKTDNLLTTKEAADMLGVSDQTVINWIKDGVFPNAYKLNPKKSNSPIRIPKGDVTEVKAGRRAKYGRRSA